MSNAFMCVENGRAAAPPWLRLQHRRLDLEEAAAVEVLAQGAHHAGAQAHHVAGRRARDEVDVALPDARLLGQVLVQHRQRAQRLGRHLPRRRRSTLSSPRRELPTRPCAKRWSPRSTSALKAASDSSPTTARLSITWSAVALAVLQRDEAQLAGVAQEHDAAGDADDVVGLLARPRGRRTRRGPRRSCA